MTALARIRMFAATVLQAAHDLVSPVPQPVEASSPRPYPRYTPPFPMHAAGESIPAELLAELRASGITAPAPHVHRPRELRKEFLPVISEGVLCDKCQAETIATTGTRTIPLKVRPGQRIRVVARPQGVAFRPEQIEIENAERWTVHDIKVGNRSQFAQAGDIPGEMFAPGVQGGIAVLETVQTAMDFVIEATYTGPEKDGEQFRARVTGSPAPMYGN